MEICIERKRAAQFSRTSFDRRHADCRSPLRNCQTRVTKQECTCILRYLVFGLSAPNTPASRSGVNISVH